VKRGQAVDLPPAGVAIEEWTPTMACRSGEVLQVYGPYVRVRPWRARKTSEVWKIADLAHIAKLRGYAL